MRYLVQRQNTSVKLPTLRQADIENNSHWEETGQRFESRREALEHMANVAFYDDGFYYDLRLLDNGKPVLIMRGNA